MQDGGGGGWGGRVQEAFKWWEKEKEHLCNLPALLSMAANRYNQSFKCD